VTRVKNLSGLVAVVSGAIVLLSHAFHARVPVPPELAVVVAKRFWSGQISSEAILAACKHYRPEQVLLSNRLASGDWKQFLDAGYTLVCADKTSLLYVAKALIPPGAPP
jgi:hypothetical protein